MEAADLSVQRTLDAARKSARHFGWLSQEEVDSVVQRCAWSLYAAENSRYLAGLSVKETGMGHPADQFLVHRKRVLGTLRDMSGKVTGGEVGRDDNRGTVTHAKPIGLIGAVTPATAPSASVATLALIALKTRNAIVFAPNPRAQLTTAATVDMVRAALVEHGLPAEMVACLEVTSRAVTDVLLHGADLIVGSGSRRTLDKIYRSGTPTLGAGEGNPTIIVDASADLATAAKDIAWGAGFNHGISCSSESNVLVAEEIAFEFERELRRNNVYICDAGEAKRVADLLHWSSAGINRDMVGRSVYDIASAAGMKLSFPGAKVLASWRVGDIASDAWSGEKLSPTLSLRKYSSPDDAIQCAREFLEVGGMGHSCGVHTSNDGWIREISSSLPVCRLVVNQSTCRANTGDFSNGLDFTSVLGCGTWGRSTLSGNLTWRHLLNYTVTTRPIAPLIPKEEDIFGRFADSQVGCEEVDAAR